MSSQTKGMAVLFLFFEINFMFLFYEVVYTFKKTIQLTVRSNTFHLWWILELLKHSKEARLETSPAEEGGCFFKMFMYF